VREKARLYLADSLYNAGNYNEALGLYKAIERSDASEELKTMAAYQTGWAYYSMSREGQAVDEFANFLKRYPRSALSADVMFWLAEYYSAKNKYDKAREYYYSIRKESPSSDLAEKALYQIAVTFQEEGKLPEALAKFEEFALQFPDSELARDSYRKMAKIKKEAKDFDGAIGYLKKALRSENSELNAQIQYETAECFEAKGNLEKSAEEYLEVPYLYSKGAFWSVRAQLKGAQIFERLGRVNEARKLYEKLSEMDVEESAFAKKRLEWLKWQDKKGE
jgi:TolA-binding protein